MNTATNTSDPTADSHDANAWLTPGVRGIGSAGLSADVVVPFVAPG